MPTVAAPARQDLPALPPPQTAKEAEVARSMLAFLLEELSPSVFTRKKDALETFDTYYFRIFPTYTPNEIRALYYGCTNAAPAEKAKGIFALCGMTSWKHSGLKKAAGQALGMLAKLCDRECSPHAQAFMQLFVSQDAATLKLLRFDKHLSPTQPRGNRAAASFLLALLQQFKGDTFAAVQRDLADDDEADAAHSAKHDRLAKRISLRASEDVRKKIAALGGDPATLDNATRPTPAAAAAASASASSASQARLHPRGSALLLKEKEKEKQTIRDRLRAFFGGRPSVAEMERKGLLKPKCFGVPLDSLSPAAMTTVETALAGEVRVPTVLHECCSYMIEVGIIEMQGVFRLSGDSVEIAQTRDKFDLGVVVDLAKLGPHSVSGLVKLFLRTLPQPLLRFEHYDDLIGAFRAHDMPGLEEMVETRLSVAHRATTAYLLDFLARVNSLADTNMMTDTNLAICIAPNILRPKVETYERVARDTPITIGVVRHLIATHADKMRAAGKLAATGEAEAAATPAAALATPTKAAPATTSMPEYNLPASAAPKDASPQYTSARRPTCITDEYSSSAAEAVAAAATAASESSSSESDHRSAYVYHQEPEDSRTNSASESEPERPVFVPTAAQTGLANAMANAMASRNALRKVSTSSGAIGSSPSRSPLVAPLVQLRKVSAVTSSPSLGPAASGAGGSPITVRPPRASVLIPEHYERLRDPLTGNYYYWNKLTQKVTWRKPDAIEDKLNEADVNQVFPPPVPQEAPPQEATSASECASQATPKLQPVLAPLKDVPTDELRPSILPAPPRQPRRVSRADAATLLSPPPVPAAAPAAINEETDDDGDVPVPPKLPPPTFEDDDDEPPPPPSLDAPAPSRSPAETIVQTPVEDTTVVRSHSASLAARAEAPSTASATDDSQVEEDAEWEEYTDAVSGKPYYYNLVTKITTWTNPFGDEPTTNTTIVEETKAEVSEPTEAALPTGPAVPSTNLVGSSAFPSPLYGGWQCTEIHGRWDAASAQGCYPNFSGWSRNPQYHFGVVAPADAKTRTQVVVQLQWRNLSRINGDEDPVDAGDRHIAGFYVLVNQGPSYQKLFIHADEIVARSEFEKGGSTVVNIMIDAFSAARPAKAAEPFVKNYLIIPSTFEPGYTGDFTITVHSGSQTWLQAVDDREKWAETVVHSQWLGDTAGGCRNHAATFPNNPQFTLMSSITDRPTPVLCLLTQATPASGVSHPIGWYAINQSGKIDAKGAFQGNVEVHSQFALQPDSAPYVIVPCTFSPGLEADFTLAVYAPPHAQLTLTPNTRA